MECAHELTHYVKEVALVKTAIILTHAAFTPLMSAIVQLIFVALCYNDNNSRTPPGLLGQQVLHSPAAPLQTSCTWSRVFVMVELMCYRHAM